jgi:hypothetical protein
LLQRLEERLAGAGATKLLQRLGGQLEVEPELAHDGEETTLVNLLLDELEDLGFAEWRPGGRVRLQEQHPREDPAPGQGATKPQAASTRPDVPVGTVTPADCGHPGSAWRRHASPS